ETPDIHIITAQATDTINTDELVEINESNNISSPSLCPSSISCSAS
ncbi:unnamed protein product, partial [Rotaria sordida]